MYALTVLYVPYILYVPTGAVRVVLRRCADATTPGVAIYDTYSTPESKNESSTVNFFSRQWFSKVETGTGACFE